MRPVQPSSHFCWKTSPPKKHTKAVRNGAIRVGEGPPTRRKGPREASIACELALIITDTARVFLHPRGSKGGVCRGSSTHARPPAKLSSTRLQPSRGRRNVHPAALIMKACSQAEASRIERKS